MEKYGEELKQLKEELAELESADLIKTAEHNERMDIIIKRIREIEEAK